MWKRNVRLSQCMIVKNEEKNIEQALSWGKDILYEQIVVDTGSTDRTVEMALALGAKVYHFQWNDNFADAKNFAISKATGDWIAFLDADECILPEDVDKLMPLLNKLDRTEYHVMLTSWTQMEEDGRIFASGAQTRIFRRIEGLQYRNRIHEELALNGENIYRYTVDASEELAILHTGYSHESGKGKGGRNARLIHMELEDHPDNYSMMGYLGDSYYSMGDEEEAERWYRKSISLMPEHIEEYDVRSAVTFWKLMLILYKRDDEQAMMELYEKAVRLIPKESDYDYIAGKFYTAKKDFQKAAYYLERAIQNLEKYGQVSGGDLLAGSLRETWELLAVCYYQNGNLAQCVKYSTSLLKTDRYLMSTLVMLLYAFQRDKAENPDKAADAADVAMFLGSLYNMESLKDRIFLLRSAMKSDYDDLVKIIRGTCSPVELECFDNSMRQRESQT